MVVSQQPNSGDLAPRGDMSIVFFLSFPPLIALSRTSNVVSCYVFLVAGGVVCGV